jgi:RNA-splicing ligase RtcB
MPSHYVTWEHHYGENVLITRKGAVRAREGDMGIIPDSMGALRTSCAARSIRKAS